jgi:hypothetical protein
MPDQTNQRLMKGRLARLFCLAGIGKKFGHWQGKLVCDDYGGTDFFDIPFLKNPFNLRQYCALLNCNVFCFL